MVASGRRLSAKFRGKAARFRLMSFVQSDADDRVRFDEESRALFGGELVRREQDWQSVMAQTPF